MVRIKLAVAIAITAFALGTVVHSGVLILATMVVGCAATGMAGYFFRDWEIDRQDDDRRGVARSVERHHRTSAVDAITARRRAEAAPTFTGERYPFVTRDDGAPDGPAVPDRSSPRR